MYTNSRTQELEAENDRLRRENAHLKDRLLVIEDFVRHWARQEQAVADLTAHGAIQPFEVRWEGSIDAYEANFAAIVHEIAQEVGGMVSNRPETGRSEAPDGLHEGPEHG